MAFMIVLVVLVAVGAVAVYVMCCRRLAGMLVGRLPGTGRPVAVHAVFWFGWRGWMVSNRVTEKELIHCMDELAGLYPGWIPSHELVGAGASSHWLLILRKPSAKSIPLDRLPPASSLQNLHVGLDLRNRVVSIPGDIHTLIVALTGAGKSNLMAVLVSQIIPFVRRGLARLWAIDLKNGMETGMYGSGKHQVFAREAWTMEETVEMLRDLVAECDRRAEAIRGRYRVIYPSKEFPRIYLLIDEAAQLHAGGDKKLADEAAKLLDSLLRRARAVGIVAVAFSQNPRVSSLPLRSGFPQRIGMRLNDESEARMLLGDDAVDHGAVPWRLVLPGSGFWWDTRSGRAVYFRAPFVDDGQVKAFDAQPESTRS